MEILFSPRSAPAGMCSTNAATRAGSEPTLEFDSTGGGESKPESDGVAAWDMKGRVTICLQDSEIDERSDGRARATRESDDSHGDPTVVPAEFVLCLC